MLLNSDELTGFVHLPSSAVRSPVFQRQTTKTKAAPVIVRHGNGLLLGNNEHAGETVEVRLSAEQRTRHSPYHRVERHRQKHAAFQSDKAGHRKRRGRCRA